MRHHKYTVIIIKMLGAGIAQWLEHWTRDWKVVGSNPCWSGGRIFFSRVNFLCWLLFRYSFHPRVTTVACKDPGHSAKSAGGRLQLNTHTPYICGFAWNDMVHGCMVYTERAPRRQQFHAATAAIQRCNYITTVDILKTRCKKRFTCSHSFRMQCDMSAVRLLESRE